MRRNTYISAAISLLLAVALLLSGCQWSIFRTLNKDTAAFYKPGSVFATYVPRTEAVADFPRTHMLDDYIEEAAPGLLSLMDYALANGYTGVRYALPAGKQLDESNAIFTWLQTVYPVDMKAVTVRRDGTIRDGDRKLNCIRITLNADGQTIDRFMQGLIEARRVVDTVPAGFDEFDTARYLYDYLTRNVKYDKQELNYYNGDWHLLHDALIEKLTVCTGVSEALYYLFNLAGIDCIQVYGDVTQKDGTTFGHAWNYANLEGGGYYFDATWDIAYYLLDSDYFFAVSQETLCMDAARTSGDFQVLNASKMDLHLPVSRMLDPEGTIRNYLLLKSYRDDYPLALLRFAGFLRDATIQIGTEKGAFAVYDIPYADFETWMECFVTQRSFISEFCKGAYRESEGNLAASTKMGFAHSYMLSRVTGVEGYVWTCVLTDWDGVEYPAEFTLLQQPDGSWRVDRCTIGK